jgi:hypothetical protein
MNGYSERKTVKPRQLVNNEVVTTMPDEYFNWKDVEKIGDQCGT